MAAVGTAATTAAATTAAAVHDTDVPLVCSSSMPMLPLSYWPTTQLRHA